MTMQPLPIPTSGTIPSAPVAQWPHRAKDTTGPTDLVCLSHLRWNWVYQRPQHLMTRAARDRRVLFFEEPIEATGAPRLVVHHPQPQLAVATPQLPAGMSTEDSIHAQQQLLSEWLGTHGFTSFILWYYTPMALPLARHLSPAITVYDCMDELSGFAGASTHIAKLEEALLARCDVMFTGGYALYEAKCPLHRNAHPFPSAVDTAHFAQARSAPAEPSDQREIPRPRLGYAGVLDERLDFDLVMEVARRAPEWQFVFVGPITKIEESALPRLDNIHYLGARPYAELPAYLAGWDVALMPFAHNAATRYISPTKTPEYLAAGRPVVSTSIRDVVRTYGSRGLVHIADGADAFESAIRVALAPPARQWLTQVDRWLAEQSWDATWARMQYLIRDAAGRGHNAF